MVRRSNREKIAWMLNRRVPGRSWLHAFLIIVVLWGCSEAKAETPEIAAEP